MVKIFFPSVFFLLLLTPPVSAQYYSTGQDPASIKWRQIKTKKFQLIYPSTFEKRSQYLANILEIVAREETKTLSAKVPRIPVIIHSGSSTSNGITVWAPKRIELYPCPPQSNYAEEWLEQLAIHEYRHAVQTSKMNQGFTKVLSYITGEQGIGVVLGLYIPPWFLEGDAVCTETALSNSGRGRTSSFENILRAQLLEKGTYSYDKAVLGSIKNFVPDQYALGYPLVAQARKIYGPQLWNTALDRVSRLPFMVVPFSSGIHKITGLYKVRFYKKMLSCLKSDWKDQMERIQYSDFSRITKKNTKNFSSYLHPVFLNDSTIIAEKESMDDPDYFVMVKRKNGKERKLFLMGSGADESISVGGGKLIWTEIQSDPRWQNEDFSVIRMYDFTTKRINNLTKRSRYFAPFLSPDGNKIAAIKVDHENHHSIDILDSKSGTIIQHIPLDQYIQVMAPNWSPDGALLALILLTEKGKALASINLRTQKITPYTPFSFIEISGPAFFFHHYILFTADYSGIQNIYAIDTLSKKIFQVTSSRFSASDPDLTTDRKTMIYADYSSDGLEVTETRIDTTKWIPLEKIKNFSIMLYDSLVQQEQTNIQDSAIFHGIYKMYQNENYNLGRDTIIAAEYHSNKYSKILHLFNPHSWAPLSADVNNLTIKPGISVLFQNVLNTMIASAGWEYNRNEETGKFFANLSYQGWYPVIDLKFDIGNRASYARYIGSSERFRFTWRETNLQLHTSIPWNFSRGKFIRSLTPSFGFSLINIQHNASTPEQLTTGNFVTIDCGINATQYLRSTQKDMYPRWGQAIAINFRNTPFPGNDMGSIFAAQTNLYFPGIIKHHGIWGYAGFQSQTDVKQIFYRYADIITFPRGYSGVENDQVLSLALNYKFPLFCPDFSAGSVVYFKRFSLNIFFDWAQGCTGKNVAVYQSTGAELTTNLHLLRFLIPFELGVRSIYFPSSGTWGWEFIYSVRY